MNTTEAIRKRRSIRKYQSGETISDAEIKTILEAAMMAPSARNTRPWEFIVLKSKEARQKASEVHPYAKHLSEASLGIIVCARPELQEDVCPGYFPEDCGAAVQNILLQSTELGYGSCWCGIYPREERIKEISEAFSIESIPFALIVIGKADEEPSARGFYDEERVKIL